MLDDTDGVSRANAASFDLLFRLYADPELVEIFSESSTVSRWLDVESALAQAQKDADVISSAAAAEIADAARIENIDLERLWNEAAIVGYPIFPLVRMIAEAAGPEGARRVHYGATTQDIMDTGLVLQLRAAGRGLLHRMDRLGEALSRLVTEHANTVMAGRTHGQQAVPTTFGAKCAILLDEFGRQRTRLADAVVEASVVSLFGAAGTSAGFGAAASQVRAGVASRLSLGTTAIPWHVARDRLTALAASCALLSGTLARFAREIIDLSRTEIAEVSEPADVHRGASSTMPQKANPIWSEAIIGLSVTAGSLLPGLLRSMEAGHERAAGEWQIEWRSLPEIMILVGSALTVAAQLAEELIVHPATMRKNLDFDSGNIMAETFMMALAERIGREQAHDLVSAATIAARAGGMTLDEALLPTLPSELEELVDRVTAEHYLGQAGEICREAVAAWRNRRPIPS